MSPILQLGLVISAFVAIVALMVYLAFTVDKATGEDRPRSMSSLLLGVLNPFLFLRFCASRRCRGRFDYNQWRAICFQISFLIGILFGILVLMRVGSVWWASLTASIAIALAFLQSIRKLPTEVGDEPAYWGVPTLFGKRMGETPSERKRFPIIEEGWRLLPLFPFGIGAIIYSIKKIVEEMTISDLRTPDNMEFEQDIGITFRVNKNHPIAYLDSDQRAGVVMILKNILADVLRRLYLDSEDNFELMVDEDGNTIVDRAPWEVAMASGERFLEHMLELMTGRDITREEIRNARAGRATTIEIEAQGISVERLNLQTPRLVGEAKAAAEQDAKERLQRRAELRETRAVAEMVREYTRTGEDSAGLTVEQAVQAVQSERGKVPKQIWQLGLPSEVSALLGALATRFLKGAE